VAAYEVLLLNTAVPQIQAAQSGDTYVVPRDIAFSAALTLSAGTANGVPYLSSPGKVLTTGSALTFDGTNLGVGTTSPVFSNSGQGIMVNGTTAGTVRVTQGGGTQAGEFRADASNVTIGSRTNGALVFEQFGSESMRLTTTGLGIGTSSPATKLHVQDTTVGGTPFRITGANSFAYNFRSLSDGTTDGRRFDIQVSSSSGQLSFSNSSVEFGRFDSSGNLGLGVTPSAWGAGYKAFQNGIFSLASDGTNNDLSANRYLNSGGASTYIATGFASMFRQEVGTFKFYTAPSGTAGNAISFTQAMTLSSDGTFRVKGAGTAGTTDAVQFSGSAPASAMTLDALGRLLVGGTSNFDGAKVQSTTANTDWSYSSIQTGSGTFYHHIFRVNTLAVGTITSDSSTTTYATSSDYRLKNITGPITTSGAYIDSLNPVEGTWKADGSTFVGLIAHEVQEASRTTVATGEKDGEQMQGMDYSNAELIANLIAEVKSLRARVAQLEQGA
jgi:hypothetical protein